MSMHKYIQIPNFKTSLPRHLAIRRVIEYINENISDFVDGEEISVEYISTNGDSVVATAIVKKNGNSASIYTSIEDSDTIKIVESENEPSDKEVLWLTEDSEDEGGDEDASQNLKAEIASLKKTIKKLENVVNRHDYALSSTIAGGDIVINSEKYYLENSADPEMPDGAVSNDTYATDDLVVTSFDLYIGESTLATYNKVYKGKKYYLKLKMFNNAKEVVKQTNETLGIVCSPSEIATVDENNILFPTASGSAQIVATLIANGGQQFRMIYPIEVGYNEEPYYELYGEPNVKHVLIKSAENLQVLVENAKYLCENELVWCIGEHALYIKAKAPNGSLRLYKLNGEGGSIEPDTGSTTGDTTAVTYETRFVIDNEELSIISTDENTIYVDANGILNINVGEVNGEGILILNDVTSTGSTPSTGETINITEGEVDGQGNLNMSGSVSVENGILLVDAPVIPSSNNGILEITT